MGGGTLYNSDRIVSLYTTVLCTALDHPTLSSVPAAETPGTDSRSNDLETRCCWTTLGMARLLLKFLHLYPHFSEVLTFSHYFVLLNEKYSLQFSCSVLSDLSSNMDSRWEPCLCCLPAIIWCNKLGLSQIRQSVTRQARWLADTYSLL